MPRFAKLRTMRKFDKLSLYYNKNIVPFLLGEKCDTHTQPQQSRTHTTFYNIFNRKSINVYEKEKRYGINNSINMLNI